MTIRKTSQIDTLIIHCSASTNGFVFTAKDIDQWHKARGFHRDPNQIDSSYPLAHIGYHYVIGVDGALELGRKLMEVGAHCQGHNARSIGICLIGTDRFTLAQWHELERLVKQLMFKFDGIFHVKGHRDFSPDRNGDGKISPNEYIKQCPSFNVLDWLKGKMQPLEQHIYTPFSNFIPPIKDAVGNDSADTVTLPKPAYMQDEASISTFKPQAIQPLLSETAKPWWQSQTILSAILAILPPLVALFDTAHTVLQQDTANGITVGAGILAIIGRLTARHTLK